MGLLELKGAVTQIPRTHLAVVAIGLVVVYLFARWFPTWWRLRHIPGPFWASITDLPKILWVKTGRAHLIHQKLHEKYGELVRIGPNTVIFRSPTAIPTVYPMRPGFPKVSIILPLNIRQRLGSRKKVCYFGSNCMSCRVTFMRV